MSDVDSDYEEGDANTYEEGDANTAQAATACAVLEYVAKSIVDQPDALSVEIDDERSPLRLNVHAAPDDLGRLIGRRGRVAGAIRTVVRAAATRDGLSTVDVEFVE